MNGTPWPDLMDLLDYWIEDPPTHIQAGRFFERTKKKKKTDAPAPPQEDMKALAGLINGN